MSRRVGCSCTGGSESWSLFVLVSVVVFVTPLAPRPADCRVVAAPRRCVASRAGIRIVSQVLAKPRVSELSVLAPDEESSVEGPMMQKDGFTGRDSCTLGSFPPVGIGYDSRASDCPANQVSSEHFLRSTILRGKLLS